MSAANGIDMTNAISTGMACFPRNRSQNSYAFTSRPGFVAPRRDAMIIPCKQSVAKTITIEMHDANNDAPLDGLALTIKLSKAGGALATITPTVVGLGGGTGLYTIALTASHLDTLGMARLYFSATTGVGQASAQPNDRVCLDVYANSLDDIGVTSRRATAQGPGTGSNQIQLDASASAIDHIYRRQIISIVGGTGIGQANRIIHYIGATKTATLAQNWTTAPDATSVYQIVPDMTPSLSEGLAQTGGASTITLKSTEPSTTDFYKGVWISLISGTGAGQNRLCTAYDGTTKIATVDLPWKVNPDSTTGYWTQTGASVMPAGATAIAGASGGVPLQGGAIPNANAGASTGLPVQGGAVPNANAGAVGGLPTISAVGQGPGGTLKPNSVIDNYVYNAKKQPTSWRVRAFASAAASDTAYAGVNTSTGQGRTDGTDGEIEREKYTAEYDATTGNLLALKRHKDL